MTAAGLVLSAWLALAAWSMSPYAEWLDHARMEHIAAPADRSAGRIHVGLDADDHRHDVARHAAAAGALFGEHAVQRASPCAGDPGISGGSGLVFGSFSYLGDSVLHEIVEQLPALAGVIAPGVLLLAGVYQLTPMKRACLSRCRLEGRAVELLAHSSRRNSWTLGLLHGVFCLGSCWALMLLMFAGGGVNLIWMLILCAVMAAERLTRHGAYLAHVVGVLLILCWAASVLQNTGGIP